MGAVRKSRRPEWTEEQYLSTVRALRSELDEKFEPDVFIERLRYLSVKIDALADRSDSDSRLEMLVCMISAMVWNLRAGLARHFDHQRFADLSRDLLRIMSIPLEGSKLSFLHGQIMNLDSQYARLHGEHWRAFWFSSLSVRYSNSSDSIELHSKMTTANRLFRIGHLDAALDVYEQVLAGPVAEATTSRAAIESVRLCRISGRLDDALRRIESVKKLKLSAQEIAEIDFERLCVDAVVSGKIRPILLSVKKGQPHHDASFIIESVLWAFASRDESLREEIYSLKSQYRNWDLRSQGEKTFYSCAAAIVDMTDRGLPLELRLEQIGQALADSNRLLTIDKELLFLVAAGRVLSRARLWDMANACLREYEAFSMRLSKQRSRDVFNLASDMLEANWYR
jgi:hypothetical protein